jgi:hypothetical protein
LTELARTGMTRRIRTAAENDPRVVGLVDYGSSSEGRDDAWSDVDVTLFVRDAELDAFKRDWKGWAAQFGTLLLAYVGGVGHPWAVYAATPIPLRVDFEFQAESAIDALLTWPNAPVSVAAMVLYDATGGRLTATARQLVGQSLRPADPAATFDSICGDFWYYILRTYSRIVRGQEWGARQDFEGIVMNLLFALLRLEVGATERWRASSAATGIELVLPAARLAQLESCIPGPGMTSIQRCLAHAAALGQQSCAACAAHYGWAWPEVLAARTLALLGDDAPTDAVC